MGNDLNRLGEYEEKGLTWWPSGQFTRGDLGLQTVVEAVITGS